MSQPEQGRRNAPGSNTQTRGSSNVTRTQLQTQSQRAPRILRLRGEHNANGRSVQWAEDVVDNEGLNRKSSKVCCIYHKPKAVGESSDESSSSSDSDSDSDSGRNLDQRRRKPVSKRRGEKDDHEHDHEDCGHDHDHDLEHNNGEERSHRKIRAGDEERRRKPSPNAYEKVPKVQTKGEPALNKSTT